MWLTLLTVIMFYFIACNFFLFFFYWKKSSLMQYNPTTVLPYSAPSQLLFLPSPPDPPLHYFLQKSVGLQETTTNRTEQHTIRQGTSPHIEARQGNPIRGRESQGQAKEFRDTPALLLGVPPNTKLITRIHMQRT